MFRNIIFAPISEEIVFRSVIIASLYVAAINNNHNIPLNGNDSLQIALASPIWFAAAHIHHIYDKVKCGMGIGTAILSTLIQMFYTSIFGFISAILFMRTGSIFSSIISHMICNFMGLPDIGFMFHPDGGNPYRSEYSSMYKYRYPLFFLHCFGLVLFCLLLFPLTSEFTVHSFYWKN